MRLKNINTRILNIYKGKLAEGLLKDYADQHGLKMDFSAGESGFWTRDSFDFLFDGIQWDLKNNFTRNQNPLPLQEYLHLPALVPSRHDEDQWQRSIKAENKGFLFTFMAQHDFPGLRAIKLSGAQIDFIRSANQGEVDRSEKPFEEDWFFDELSKRGERPFIEHSGIPELVITGYCTKEQYAMFLETDGIEHFNYAMYTGKWYKLDAQNRLNFRGGLVRTRIKNATCPIEALPSFKSFIEASGK